MTERISTREVTIASHDGKSFGAYLTVPASGRGPGLVLCQEIFGVNDFMRRSAQLLAEEGYVVLVPDLFWRQQPGIQLTDGPADMPRAFELYKGFDVDEGIKDIASTLAALRDLPEQEGGAGVLGYCLGGKLAYLAACRSDADVAVGYYGVGIEDSLEEAANLRGRLVLHIAEQDGFCPPEARARILEALGGKPGVELYVYPGVDHAFARTGGDHYDKPSALMAHQRSMAALQRTIGPEFDYSYLWDKHCEYEFGTRDVAATMATMVAEPYVNHIPTMTGGVGHKELSRFYQHHFVNSNPPDTRLVPLSRTVGATQIVDELLFCFTHTTEIDWMLPGVAPTGKYVEIPLVAIVKFRGDKLYHEHIYWDQASVLVQVGLLDPKGLPTAGRETAAKLLDETLPSNTLMARWKDSENK
ncbi:dienelactone hydrolase family protein [Achromobacter mucicolens]|uniref:dienelactone hydrolase family protein n=1 Tax=Achromobacter mucicolens TaxID=1389922 RepID=UPI00244CF48C|nr:dienelactone hydrolase family protein [Achromobacter mucicolens]MDG9971131.1 dienelactone hydrolase family protein [Achromobacter mucicolens]